MGAWSTARASRMATTMDIIKMHGVPLRTFLDVGGNASEDQVRLLHQPFYFSVDL
jgi:succinyl-CoA synthetase beta subunit